MAAPGEAWGDNHPPESRRRPLGESVLVTHAKHKCWWGEGGSFSSPLYCGDSPHPEKAQASSAVAAPPPRFNYSAALSLINRQAGRRDLFVCVNVRDSIKTLMALFQAQRSGRRIVTFDTDTT